MTRAAVRERAQARRAADAAFREAFDAYMFECFAKPGFKLESEAQLAERFGVTRYKVRKAEGKRSYLEECLKERRPAVVVLRCLCRVGCFDMIAHAL